MNQSQHSLWLHRFAVLTVALALLPVLVGALVTTKDAGMAFRDWPSSDGHNMLLYPWFQSAGAKFLEHGHRLAGIVIGLFSIALAGVLAKFESRRWVRSLGFIALACVITQGLLGGQRVLLDARGLAFVHGSFASLVLALFATIATVTAPGWHRTTKATAALGRLRTLSLITCAAIFVQYVLGGLLRHQGMVLYEHLGFAFVVLALVAFLTATVFVSGENWLHGPAAMLGLLVVVQLALGAGAWVTKFGFGGNVAVYGSAAQVWMRTSHVLTGMLLFMTAVVLAVRIARLTWLARDPASTTSPVALDGSLSLRGGVQ